MAEPGIELGTLWLEGRDLTNCAKHVRPSIYQPVIHVCDHLSIQPLFFHNCKALFSYSSLLARVKCYFLIYYQSVAGDGICNPFRKGYVCAGCDSTLTDKYVLKASGLLWHSECLRCTECKVKLQEKCFFREGAPLCQKDFFRYDEI